MKRRTFLQTSLAGALLGAAGGTVSPSAEAAPEKNSKKESGMNIVIAADPFAVDLKDAVVEHLKEKGHTVIDAGATKDKEVAYYDCASAAAKMLQDGKAERGILFCGTGAGVSIVANKFKGVNAVCVESVFAARMARVINDSNALTMGAMIVAPWMAKEMVDAWMESKHTEGLEQFAGFLKDAVGKVDAINEAHCQ